MKNIRIHPSPTLQGVLKVPGDKSISHRAIMLGALAKGKSVLTGLLLSEDVLATIACFRAMGVSIEVHSERVEVEGVGLHGLQAPAQTLDCGNSGTTLRLMMGILAGQPFTSRLTGDASLNRRPVERVAEPLKAMGAQIEEFRSSETQRVVKIEGRPLHGREYRLPIPSAQVKSAILLAGLFATGETTVIEPIQSRDHTEILLEHKGVALERREGILRLKAPAELSPEAMEVPGDISSAAFFLVGACLGQNSKIRLRGVGVNPTRIGILEVLRSMGARIQEESLKKMGGEAVADLEVQASTLKGTRIAGKLIPRLIDEIPILSLAAAAAEGTTQILDARELRVKETDRIQSIEEELTKLKVQVRGLEDGLIIEGPNSFQAGTFQSHSDHRIAMSMAIAATVAPQACIIEDVECVQTSFPSFFQDLAGLGVRFEWVD